MQILKYETLIDLVERQQSLRLYNIMGVLIKILHKLKNKNISDELFNRLFNLIDEISDAVIDYLEMVNDDIENR